jgi:O-antigen ligase
VALVLGATLRRHEDWRLLAWLMVLLTAAHAVPGLLEAQRRGTLDAAMAGQFSYGVRITGTAANPIVFGWNMIYGVPAALYLATVERQPLLRAVALGLGAFGLAVSFLTLNRQGFVLAAVAIGATVLLGPARHRKALAVGAGVAAGLGALALLPVMIRRLAASFSAAPGGASGGIFRDPSFLERHDAFLTGMQALLAHPVGGIGLGAFPYVWREFYPRDGSTYFYQSTLEVRYRYLDSGYVQVLVETGLAGTLVVGVAVGVLAWSVVRARRQLMVAGDRQAVAAAGWVLGLGTFVAVGTLVQDTLLNPRVWVLFGMGLGLVGMAQGRLSRTAD